ncbi:MAG: Fur family transcriptional regulator [Actinomycetota bacterium]
MRPTRPRQAVLSVLERTRHRQLSAQDLHRAARRAAPRIGLATVYRALAALESEGAVEVISQEGGESAYRLCSPGHHHHLVCNGCGAVVEIDECDVEPLARRLARRHRFRIDQHDVTFRGRCAACRSRPAAG